MEDEPTVMEVAEAEMLVRIYDAYMLGKFNTHDFHYDYDDEIIGIRWHSC